MYNVEVKVIQGLVGRKSLFLSASNIYRWCRIFLYEYDVELKGIDMVSLTFI
jgi:hypothetical protein